MHRLITISLIMLCLLFAGMAFAAGPNLMSYQGQVLTALGAPVANGVYPATFTIFNAPVAGFLVWGESGTITTSAGLFTHLLVQFHPFPPACLRSTARSGWKYP